jgi:hypothetical protein
MTTAELVECKSLERGSLIDVETKSRHYQIECLGGNTIRISGHPEFCPEPVKAQLQGSFDVDGNFELGLIGRGMRLRFLLGGGRPVTTSRVMTLHVDRPMFVPPMSSSIH